MSYGRFGFGAGAFYMRPVGGNQPTNPTPVELATLQDISIDISLTNKELQGQNIFPDDVAPAKGKITGKAKFARISSVVLANMLGQSVSAGRKRFARNESATVPASTPFTHVVTNGADFVNDYGVTYANSGQPFTRVSGTPTTGQYSVDETTGTYTFAAADTNAAVFISYEYKDTTNGTTVAMMNELQGYGPVLEGYFTLPYDGDAKDMRLFAVRITKYTTPTKQGDYSITEVDFEAFANAAGQVFEFYEG